jgi:hypothetical protein
MKKKLRYLSFLILIIGLVILQNSCGKKKPTALEGLGSVLIKVGFDITAKAYIDPDTMRIDSVEVTWLDIYGRRSKHPYYTNSKGEVLIDSLFSSKYKIDALKVYSLGEGRSIKFSGSVDKVATISGEETPVCEINLRYVATGIKINEIYYGGPYTNELYYDDQYIELYNPEDDTLYLDGMIICRVSTSYYEGSDPHQYYGQDNDGDDDMDKVVLIVQFPGTPITGREYPIAPGQFVICACTPINHKGFCMYNCQYWVDLSQADFEFFNPISTRDHDYPNIPNITNIYENKTTIFMISLASDVIILADGSDATYLDGIYIPSIVDGVEYRSSVPKEKALTILVDQGYTGIGFQKYTGLSVERIIPGYDTNNSTNDFEITTHPTVGYNHTPAEVWHPQFNSKIIHLNSHRIK